MSAAWRQMLLVVIVASATPLLADDEPNFQRDIRPILSENCFRCHGFDENARKADLRLDQFAGATQATDSRSAAIVPLKPDESELIARITSDDPQLKMPPRESGKSLTPVQIELLRKWISKGARYTKHWAFEAPVSPPLPNVRNRGWIRNPIDAFVLHRLETAGLKPQTEASPARLLRRVSLDLTGLPPTLDEQSRFLQAAAVDLQAAYTAEVDRLLSSPHFGERMAIDWMDAARYADTNGYFGDNARQAWPWRDWVIRAFNDNQPFDQFTIEQLAGDLLPQPSRDQLVATGFHRNSMANDETGIIDEEYRVEAVADRVDTTASVWLGMTVGCAQCHDHKFDPISQREYYQLFAYFNNTVETGLIHSHDPPPTIEVPTADQAARWKLSQELRGQADQQFQSLATSLDAELTAWEAAAPSQLSTLPTDALLTCDFDAPPAKPQVVGTTLQLERGIRNQAAKFDATQHVELPVEFDADRPWTISVWLNPTGSLACAWSKIEPQEQRRGIEMICQKGRLQINLVHRWGVDEIAVTTRDPMPSKDWHHALVSYDGSRKSAGLCVMIDGREAPLTIHRDSLSGSLHCAEPLRIGRRDAGLGFYGMLDEFRILQRVVTSDEATGWADSERLRGVLARPAADRNSAEQTVLREYYITHRSSPQIRAAYEALQQARKAEAVAKAAIPTALVMQERTEARKTHLLTRGQYDKPASEVEPGVPSVFPSLPAGARPNRLELARWLVSRQHPLTARVAVNRLWQLCFGEGLVRTPQDFGSQGESPTHPELLDDLAVRFMDSGWDVKGMLRLIVTSATYRQSSQSGTDLQQRDPDNRLLARGPRFRLPAELVRDQALAVSGLMSRRIGGPSVKPYQPEGLWEAVSYNAEGSYVIDQDEGLWRRSLYTYWKRQAPPPALLSFDANTREKCVLRRSRTNTPLQALVVLNDPTYVEAARVLAARTLSEQADDSTRLKTLFQRVVCRLPEPAETQAFLGLLMRQRTSYAADIGAAEQLINVGKSRAPEQLELSELAAWTLVAQTMLNLDEVITRR